MLDELSASGLSLLAATADALQSLPGPVDPAAALSNLTTNTSAVGMAADSAAMTTSLAGQHAAAPIAAAEPSFLANLDSDLLSSAVLLPTAPDILLAPNTHGALALAWESAAAQLSDFLRRDWHSGMVLAFGDSWQPHQGQQLLNDILSGQLRPQLELLPMATLQAQGAFAAASNTLFLAEELAQRSTLATLTGVLLEELGHFIDSQLNPVDSQGDEGALFAALVRQQPLTPMALRQLQLEDDAAVLIWQNQPYAVEQAALTPGVLTVNSSGQISVQFVFDSGAYTGQLAVFSLTGMETLQPGSEAFIQEAARRALSNSSQGRVVVNDNTDGAALTGQLGERDRNSGLFAGSRTVAMQAGDQIAVMLVPQGTVEAVLQNPLAQGALRPLFSLAQANPDSRIHVGQLSANPTGGTYGFEDVRFDQSSDGDYNDIIFSIEGATGQVAPLLDLVNPNQSWPGSTLGRQLFAFTPANPGLPGGAAFPPKTGGGAAVLSSFSGSPVKFTPAFSEAQIAATGAARVTVGSRTLYIGTNQVTAINQNPIIASFDSANPLNNWVRTDYEATGADGRGLGLAWDGANLYGIFTVDGTQGAVSEDFRRASASAEQPWLRSYGSGGGPKVSVLGRIDPATGQLLSAAYLSALLSNGNSNSLTVTGLAVNSSSNLVISAESYFAPRRPNGQAMTQITTGSSPFAYTVELTPDLRRVVSTAAVGWS